MALWTRLAALCLSLALLGGILLHDVANADMSLKMTVSLDESDLCPACSHDAQDQIVCAFDCTVPVLSTAGAPVTPVITVVSLQIAAVEGKVLHGTVPDFDPSPPRTSILI